MTYRHGQSFIGDASRAELSACIFVGFPRKLWYNTCLV